MWKVILLWNDKLKILQENYCMYTVYICIQMYDHGESTYPPIHLLNILIYQLYQRCVISFFLPSNFTCMFPSTLDTGHTPHVHSLVENTCTYSNTVLLWFLRATELYSNMYKLSHSTCMHYIQIVHVGKKAPTLYVWLCVHIRIL